MTGWPEGYRLIRLAEVDSTLDEARRQAAASPGPTWIVAERQTAARGRRGRAWHQPAGNFAAALLLPDPGGPARAALHSFVAALAVADALAGHGADPALKWPNDVLLAGAKVAGILLEGLPGGALAVGIGVNLAAAPPPTALEPGALPATALADHGAHVTPDDFLPALAHAWEGHATSLRRHGFAPIRHAWLARAAGLGGPITVRLPGETLTGRFADMDEDGQLVLSTPQGARRRIAAGEVFF